METKDIKIHDSEHAKFKGKFIYAVGRRKTAVAQIRLYRNGTGIISVNDKKMSQYFSENELSTILIQPLKLTGNIKNLDFSIIVRGGGKRGQAEAARHGIARALLIFDKNLRPTLKTKGLVTRDARKKERKKPGLKKARRAPQWSKR